MENKIKAYFERIGLEYNPSSQRGMDELTELQYAHVTAVPYENLDIVNGVALSLDNGDLFEKVVVRGRGGYCFELNGLFKWLLDSLGYKTVQYLARFLRGESEIPKGRHRIIIAECEGKRVFCDVGVGNTAPRYPLILEENTVQEQFGEAYRFKRDETLGWILEERNSDGEWSNYISFSEDPLFDKDFETPSFYCEKHPSSPFHTVMLSLKTADGRVTVDGNVFRRRKNGDVVEEKELTPEEFEKIKSVYFGL